MQYAIVEFIVLVVLDALCCNAHATAFTYITHICMRIKKKIILNKGTRRCIQKKKKYQKS